MQEAMQVEFVESSLDATVRHCMTTDCTTDVALSTLEGAPDDADESSVRSQGQETASCKLQALLFATLQWFSSVTCEVARRNAQSLEREIPRIMDKFSTAPPTTGTGMPCNRGA